MARRRIPQVLFGIFGRKSNLHIRKVVFGVSYFHMKKLSEYKHLFFDLDDTLTLTKSPITNEIKDILASSGRDIIVVSGADIPRITLQTDNMPSYKLGQNGNDSVDMSGNRLWQDYLSTEEKNAVLMHTSELLTLMYWDVKDAHDLIEDRGCQVSFSVVGHHEDVPYKKSFDPHSEVRLRMLLRYPFTSDIMEVKIGGTTTFDYFKKGAHKGSNVARLIEHMGWRKEDSIYFGDKLHDGGNDESVVGVINTIAVENHDDTYSKLKEAFG